MCRMCYVMNAVCDILFDMCYVIKTLGKEGLVTMNERLS